MMPVYDFSVSKYADQLSELLQKHRKEQQVSEPNNQAKKASSSAEDQAT
jgi:hypothetical protein